LVRPASVDEYPVFAVVHDVGHAADAARDDRQCAVHRVEQHAANAFAIRRQHEDVEGGEEVADVLDEARERHVAQTRGRALEHALILTAADEHEVYVAMSLLELARDRDDVDLALLVVVERADVAD
jgi:hypothetical protein